MTDIEERPLQLVPDIRRGQQLRKWTTDATSITAREQQALDMVVLGATYVQIAKALDMKTSAGAYQMVKRALQKRADQQAEGTVEEARALYLDRLELLWRRWLPIAMGNPAQGIMPDDKALKGVLDILTRYAKVTGIEAPTRVEQTVEVTVGHQDEQRQRVLEGLRAFHERTLEGEVTSG